MAPVVGVGVHHPVAALAQQFQHRRLPVVEGDLAGAQALGELAKAAVFCAAWAISLHFLRRSAKVSSDIPDLSMCPRPTSTII